MPAWSNWLAERVVRLRQTPARLRPDLFRAIFTLFGARLALRLVSFQRLTRFFLFPPREPRASFAARRRVAASARVPFNVIKGEISTAERTMYHKRIWWSINLGTWFLPGKTVCFPRAIAAQILLRRLGIGTTLYYGAASQPGRGLTTHVWLQDGNEILIGRHEGQHYHVLAQYPQPN